MDAPQPLTVLSSIIEPHVTEAEIIEPQPKPIMGRPCEYCKNKDEILKTTQAYLNGANGDKPKMVFIGELALKLDCDTDTIRNWADKKTETGELEHPDFFGLIKKLNMIQELRLQQRVLGRFNPTGAIFLLKTKHDYIETEKKLVEETKNFNLNINVNGILDKVYDQQAIESTSTT